jgi:hypothetical protein
LSRATLHWGGGGDSSSYPLVYEELRKLAAARMAQDYALVRLWA